MEESLITYFWLKNKAQESLKSLQDIATVVERSMDALSREMTPNARLKGSFEGLVSFIEDMKKEVSEEGKTPLTAYNQKLKDQRVKVLSDLDSFLRKANPFALGDFSINGSVLAKVSKALKQVQLRGSKWESVYKEAKDAWADWYAGSQTQVRIDTHIGARMAINSYLAHVEKDPIGGDPWFQHIAQVSTIREARPTEPKESDTAPLYFAPNPIPAMKKRLKLLGDLAKGYHKVIKLLVDVVSSVPKALADMVKKVPAQSGLSLEEKEKMWKDFADKMKANAKKAVAALGRIPNNDLPHPEDVVFNTVKGKPVTSATKDGAEVPSYSARMVLFYGLGDALRAPGFKDKYPYAIKETPSASDIEEDHQRWLNSPTWTKL